MLGYFYRGVLCFGFYFIAITAQNYIIYFNHLIVFISYPMPQVVLQGGLILYF